MYGSGAGCCPGAGHRSLLTARIGPGEAVVSVGREQMGLRNDSSSSINALAPAGREHVLGEAEILGVRQSVLLGSGGDRISRSGNIQAD